MVLWAGRHHRPEWEVLCADYRQRIERELPIDDRMIKAGGSGKDPGRKDAEGEALLAALPQPCWSIALDPRARPASTGDLAKELRRLREEWPHPIAFILGSDLGLAECVLQAVRQRLSLGKMVFGHELARLALYEQLYRSISIGKGIKYHRF
ncbi:MAG: 23S rRNA (pseudouridine(1915)-N(3))-methyltransferase RlmH [Thermoanaerobaculia bacterium]|nr:23S rRNA (pseudouridine(1915)-N(3))-methyltransferase RlmH [Thermoanaerobaculia bacterium]